MKHSIQSVWKRAGKVEKTFAAALILYLILLATWPGSGFETIVAFVTFVLGAWIALRLLRLGLRKLTWSLRNRLMVAYLFIAVLPILLVLMLVGLGAYILAGQVAVYLVRSELDRRLVSLRSVAQDLSLSQANIQQVGETDQQRFPGLILWVRQNGVAKRWPPNADVSLPASLAANSRGLALRNDRYYAWADVVAGDQQVLALAPLSPRYLSTMMPALGDVYFTRLGAGDEGALSPAGGEAPRTALSPPVNQLDIPVRWGSLMQAVDWGRPERTETALLVGYARLSSILTTILSQSSDELGGAVLVFFYAVAVAFLIVAVAGLAIGISMSRSITGAVHSLYEGTERVMRGDFSHLIGVSGRDQLAELSGSFNTMTKNLERLLVVAKEKERMEAEIEIARGVQDQLYPKAPPVFESLQVLGCCHPARMVSGDYYDYQLVDGKLAIAIGDVAGKGISAALLMATIQAAMRMELRASVDMAAPSMNGLRFSTARMVSELNQQRHHVARKIRHLLFRHLRSGYGSAHLYECGPFAAGSVSRGCGNSSGCQWHRGGRVSVFHLRREQAGAAQRRLAGVLHRRHHRAGERVWRNVRGRAPD